MPGYFAGKMLAHGILAQGKALKLTGLGGGFGAKLFGAGTSASPAIMSAVGANALQFYVRHTGATGDNRLMYLRLYLQGGAGGECLRAFTTINENAGTAHGAHLSLNFALTKKLSGLGVASRNTLHIPNDATSTGTLAATQSEVFLDGTSSNPTNALVALHRYIVDGGDATAKARIKNFIEATLPTGAYNGGNMHLTTNDAAITEGLRCVINGNVRYIALFTSPVAP